MNKKTLGSTLAFCFLGWAACFAADPQMGTWKLNEAKSKITPGTTKFATATFKNSFANVKITQDGTGPDGKPIHVEWSGKSLTTRTRICNPNQPTGRVVDTP